MIRADLGREFEKYSSGIEAFQVIEHPDYFKFTITLKPGIQMEEGSYIESEAERKVLGYLNEHGLDPKQFDTAPNFEGTGISTDKEGRQVNNLTLLKKK